MNVNLTISLPEEVIEKLREVSKETHIPMSRIIRIGLDKAFEELEK